MRLLALALLTAGVSFAQEPVRAALTRALAPFEIHGSISVEIVDTGGQFDVDGLLDFPVGGLLRPATKDSVVIWRGRSIYDGGRRSHPVWARVRVTQRRKGVVAAHDIPVGAKLNAADFRAAEWDAYPLDPVPLLSAPPGCIARRPILTGSPLRADLLVLARAIEPGSVVRVRVGVGGARVEFEGKAETGGRAGDTIYVRNPLNGRRFRGIAEGPGEVKVVLKGI
jgi:flagella basal body P-ring formation protein FlgA